MNSKTLGLTLTSVFSAFLMLLVWLPQAQAAGQPQVFTAKSFLKTAPLRSLHGLNLPPVMRRVVGDQKYTSQQLAQLRDKLAQGGYVKAANQYFTIPLLKKQPAMQTAPVVHDPVLQRGFSATRMMQPKDFTVPSASFDALGVTTSGGNGCAPPDTNAAAGETQVVEIVNCAGGAGQGTFAVYSKTGTLLLGPVALGNLWTTGVCVTGEGDNVVDYDQLAQRWVISQFAGSGVPTDECVAVSVTGDATGAYYVYDFPIAPGNFEDYPKIAVWPDAYYLSSNEFNGSGTAFVGVNFTALDRAQMLAGDPNAQMVNFPPSTQTTLAYSVLPADLDGANPPPAGAPGIFVNYVSPFLFTGAPYALEVWQLHVDWTTPSNSTLGGPTELDVAAFNDGICGGSRACIPQPSPGEGLDSLGDRLMFRLAYRVTSDGIQHLVVNHTVGSGTPSNPPSGIRWYELTAPSGSIDPTQWAVAQQSTFIPADGSSRWMGSIAMDQSGNMALGYSLSSSSINPSIAYTGRLATDPAGQMTQPETTVLTGGGVQTNTDDRWGDYSSMVMDPSDDCTFWYAQEYYATTGSFAWSTHLAAFKFPNCTSGPSGTLTGTVTDAGTGNPIAGVTITLTPNQIVAVTDSNGNYTLNLPVGSYTATASDFGYVPQSDPVTISNGVTTTQNFALAAAPSATVSGNLVDGTPSGHTYGLYGEIKVTTPGFGQVADVWTNPKTGAYSVNLPEGSDYTFAATAYLAGYTPGSVTITGLAGNTTQNIPVTVSSSCAAPGYAFISGFGQDFDEGFPPTGWTVTNNGGTGSTVVWNTNTSWGDANWTGGSGIAADAESDKSGYFGVYDTALITPEIPVASLGSAPVLTFDLNFIVFSGNEALDVDVSGDGGTTWTNVAHFTTSQGTLFGLPGTTYQAPFSIPSGATQIELRWRYYNLVGGNDWYAQVDDIAIGQCGAVSGGLVVGAVSDSNTGTGLVGATLTDDETPPATTTTFQNLADTNLPVGYYFLFAGTGNRTVTASDSGYTSSSASLTVADNSVTEQDYALGAGRLSGTPAAGFNLHVMVNNQVTKTFTIANTGNAAATFTFLTFDNPPPSAPGQGLGAPLDLIQCDHVSNLSLLAQSKKGHGFGCGDDSFTGGGGSAAPDDAPWTNIANYPTPIMDNSAAQDPATGLVYSFAGTNGLANVAAANVYDSTANTWTAIANMPVALEKPTGVFISGKLYVADGWDSSGNPSAALSIYDPSSNTWTAGANNPVPWGGGAVAVALNNKMYVIGGCSASTCGQTTVEYYDPSAGSWSSAAAQYPIPDAWESCGVIGGKIYCAGGSAAAETPNTYVYDPTANTWTQLASIPVAAGGLWGSGYTATSQGLLISGGVTNNFATVTNQGFIYSPGSNTWAALPNSNNTLYRGGSACGFDKIGGSTGGFSPVPNSEMLPGYNVCGTSPIPWLTLNPVTGTVAAGKTAPVQFTFNGTGQAEFTTSQAYVLLTGNTPYGSQTVPLTVTWDPQPVDVKVLATANLGTVETGDVIVYKLVVQNQQQTGNGTATQVMLNYTMPAYVTYITTNGPAPCTATGIYVTCNIGTLAPGAQVIEQILVTDSAVQKLVSTFKVTAREPDSNPKNNTATVTTNVVGISNVSIASYTASTPSVTVGGPVTYNLSVNNAGPDPASSLTVTAPLPASLTFMSATASAGSCSNNGGLVTCNLGDLPANASATIGITATANTAGTIYTVATIGTDSVVPPGNQTSGSTGITVVTKAAPPAPGTGNSSATPPSSGSNGGGGDGLGILIALAGLAVLRRTRRGRSTPQ